MDNSKTGALSLSSSRWTISCKQSDKVVFTVNNQYKVVFTVNNQYKVVFTVNHQYKVLLPANQYKVVLTENYPISKILKQVSDFGIISEVVEINTKVGN